MGLVIALTFIGVFAVVALPLLATASESVKASRQAAAALESVISAESQEVRQHLLDVRKQSHLSNIPWLNRKLHNFHLGSALHRLLEQANLSWSAGRFLMMTGLCFAVPVCIVYLYFNMLAVGLLVGLILAPLPFAWVMFLRSKRLSKFEAGLPEALDLMVSALRAGHSLIAAMGLVSRECADPVGGEFKVCFEEQNYGLEINTALDNLQSRIPLQDIRMVATAILIQKESGGNLAEVLNKTSSLIRERFRLKRQIKVHTAQGRMTGWVLTFVPVVLGIAMYFVNPDMVSILWHRDIGIKLMWAAAGMTALGGFVISRIVDIDV